MDISQSAMSGLTPTARHVTMKEVAALAGVSPKTVSRVINHEARVSPETESAVLEAIRRLDYHLDMRASSLRHSDKRTRTVGLLVSRVDNPFSGELQRGVEDAASANGSAVITSSLDESTEREQAVIDEFAARHVDGIIVETTSENPEHITHELRHGIPIVYVDRAPLGINVDSVASDNYTASLRATSHLIHKGHRRIGLLLGKKNVLTMSERQRGYTDALSQNGISIDDNIIISDLTTPESADIATKTLMNSPNPPTALFSGQNTTTIGAVRALHKIGIQENTAMIAFDEVPLSDIIRPSLTVIEQFPRRMGETAAKLLFRRLSSPTMKTQQLIIPTLLTHRESGDIPFQGQTTRAE